MQVLWITFLLVGFYSWLSVVECGISLLRLLPRTTLTKQGLRLSTPLWGLTNVLLVCVLVGLALFFNRSATAIIHLVSPVIVIGLIALCIRALLVVQLFYRTSKTGFRSYNLLYCLLTFTVPLSFGAAGIRLLSDGMFWQSGLGLVLFGALAIGLVALAIAFVYFVVGHTPHDRLHQLSLALNISMVGLLAIGLRLTITATVKHLHSSALPVYEILLLSMIVVQIGLYLTKRDRYMWWYLSLFAIVTPVFLALADKSNLLLLR